MTPFVPFGLDFLVLVRDMGVPARYPSNTAGTPHGLLSITGRDAEVSAKDGEALPSDERLKANRRINLRPNKRL